MLDERMVSGSLLDTDITKLGKSKKKDKDKKEPKQRKPRELSVQKDINFFECVKNDRKRNVKKNASKLNLICICGLVAIIGVSYIGLAKMNSDLKGEMRATNRYINDPMVKIQIDTVNKNKADVEAIGRLTSSAKVTQETMVLRPLIKSEILAKIVECMPKSVTYNAIEYEKGVIILSCKSPTDIVAADFVNALRNVTVDREVKVGEETKIEKVKIFENTTYETVARSVDTQAQANAVVEGIKNSFEESDTTNNLPSNAIATNPQNNVNVSSSEDNGIVSVLKKIVTGPLVSSTVTNYKYDYNIIITLENAEVDADEVK